MKYVPSAEYSVESLTPNILNSIEASAATDTHLILIRWSTFLFLGALINLIKFST